MVTVILIRQNNITELSNNMHYVDNEYQFLLEKHLPETFYLNTLFMNKSALICLHFIYLFSFCNSYVSFNSLPSMPTQAL